MVGLGVRVARFGTTPGRWLIALALATSAAPAIAIDPDQPLDELSFDYWRVESGLPQGSVTAILRTHDGYLWVGTQEGLVRFDGVRFMVFDQSNSPAFRSNHILSLLEGPDGALWIGTFGGGLLRMGARAFRAYGAEQGLPTDTVDALAANGQGGFWIGASRAGLVRFEGGRFPTLLGPRDGLPSDIVRCVLTTPEGTVWVGTHAGLGRVAGGRAETSGIVPPGQAVTALLRDAAGALWVGTTSGLIHYAGGRTRVFGVRDGLVHNQIRALALDHQKTVWVGTDGGLSRFHNGRFESLTRREGLPEEPILTLFPDPDGSLWIGMDGGGMARLREPRVVTLTTRDGLSSDNVYVVTGRKAGGVWIGNTDGGVDVSEGARFVPALSLEQVGGRVRALLEDRQGRLWIGTDRGLLAYSAGKLTSRGVEEGLCNLTVRTIAEDRSGVLWFGTDGGGLVRFDGRRFTTQSVAQGLAGSEVRAILEGKSGELWVGTYGGLSCFRDKRFTNYTIAQGLSHNLVRCLHQSDDGTLWIGTYGRGLNRLRGGRFAAVTTRNGLLSDAIFSVLEDERGYLWMSCNRGIFRVATSEIDAVASGRAKSVRSLSLDESDGMRSRECNGGGPGGWKGPDGRLYFATIKGVVVVDPTRLGNSLPPPPVVIEDVLVDGESLGTEPDLRIPPSPHRLEFRFAALTFTTPHKVVFAYRLEDFDHGWVEAGPSRTATYTEVPHGRYRFRVRASDREGVWSEAEARFDLSIAPAFHETRAFRIWLFLGLIAVIIGVFRLRTRQLRERQRELTSRIEEAVARIKVLRGLLPICSHCKRIRDDKGYWSQLEEYITERSEADFSHSLCNECVRTLYPDIAEDVLSRDKRD